jgi:hypothetical protein
MPLPGPMREGLAVFGPLSTAPPVVLSRCSFWRGNGWRAEQCCCWERDELIQRVREKDKADERSTFHS